MKKLLALLLTLALLFSLAACGGGGDDKTPSGEDKTQTSSGEMSLEEAAKEIEKITGEPMTADEVKEAMEQLAESTGKEVTAQDLVNMTRELQELDEEMNEGDETAGWPTDGYGALIPEPDWEYRILSNDDKRFLIAYDDVSVDDLKAYAEKLEAAGFDTNAKSAGEGDFWNWQAGNGDGLKAYVEHSRLFVEPE